MLHVVVVFETKMWVCFVNGIDGWTLMDVRYDKHAASLCDCCDIRVT